MPVGPTSGAGWSGSDAASAVLSEWMHPTHWMGGITLDTLAAGNPALVEYYFGDGGHCLAFLMADALQGGRDVPEGVPGEDLLQALSARRLRPNRAALGHRHTQTDRRPPHRPHLACFLGGVQSQRPHPRYRSR